MEVIISTEVYNVVQEGGEEEYYVWKIKSLLSIPLEIYMKLSTLLLLKQSNAESVLALKLPEDSGVCAKSVSKRTQ